MSTNRVVEDLQELLKTLSNERDSADAIVDVLRELDQMDLPLKIIKTFKLEHKLRCLAQDESKTVDDLAKGLLKKFAGLAQPAHKNTVAPPSDSLRRRVCALLQGTFKTDKPTDAGIVPNICVQIEAAMFNANAHNAKSKEYKAKFRTLKFNLSKNKELRRDLLEGKVAPSRLVKMNAEELANSEKRKQRKKEQDDIFKASRSDWLDANRESINKQAGIKATGGLYKCFNCKSTKTTHYQKQTRSADEPMTVFVQCTNCGKRWRC